MTKQELTIRQERGLNMLLFGTSSCSTELRGFTAPGSVEWSKFIQPGRVFWHFTSATDNEKLSLNIPSFQGRWVRIKITYVRSGMAFFLFMDYPNVGEGSFMTESLMASRLHPEKLSLNEYGVSSLKDIVDWDTLEGRIKVVD